MKNIRLISLIIIAILLFPLGFINAQTGIVTVEVPLFNDGGVDKILEGYITIGVRFNNNTGNLMTGSTNGIELSSPDGATWTYPSDPVNGAVPTGAVTLELYDGGFFVTPASLDGTSADTIGLGGFSLFKPGIPDGFDEVVATIDLFIDFGMVGLVFCIDSAFYQPSNSWVWSIAGGVGGVIPELVGGGCWEIYSPPPIPVEITNCPGALNFSHCAIVSFDFDAESPAGDPITFALNAGPGSIDVATGVWSYAPSLADVGQSLSITINASTLYSTSADCEVDLAFTNEAPQFVSGCYANMFAFTQHEVTLQMTAESVDCDPFTYFIESISPTPVGPFNIDPNTGLVTYWADQADLGNVFTVTIGVTDGLDVTFCDITFEPVSVESFSVTIEKTHNTFQGGHEMVDILYGTGSGTMGGFDFLISYDASALTFVGAIEGSVYANCGWEYFTYRYGALGNCGGGCPSGLLRVIGLAETNNGANHPACFTMGPGDSFATLDFLVTDDRTFECQYVPIRFFWMDCGDNTISSESGDSLYISENVYDFDLIGNIANPSGVYPTFFGAQDMDCFVGDPNKVPIRMINFYNGGIDIVCADSIDARGDINLNEIPNEIADAVLFSNYFIYGLSVFDINLQGQIAASDVNADGLSLSVADLVYIIRIIVGDALPFDKLAPTNMLWTHSNDHVLNINGRLGALAVTYKGNSEAILLANGMEMKRSFDGQNSRVLVYSPDGSHTMTNQVLQFNGDLISVSAATPEGAEAKLSQSLPQSFGIRNFPNPFNPTTTFQFYLPKAGEYKLTVYNASGQKVAEIAEEGVAGPNKIKWDGSGLASGVYFYRLEAEGISESHKMVLLK